MFEVCYSMARPFRAGRLYGCAATDGDRSSTLVASTTDSERTTDPETITNAYGCYYLTRLAEVVRVAESTYIASTVVTGLFLLVVWLLVGRVEDWRRYALETDGRRLPRRQDDEATESATTWVATFLVVALAVGGGAVLLVSDAELLPGSEWVALGAAFTTLVGGFLLWGVYDAVRFRGFGNAFAVLASAWAAGLLLVAAIALKLVVGG